MSPKSLRLLGLICLVAALLLFILNLKHMANASTYWVALPLLMVGVVLLARSRRH